MLTPKERLNELTEFYGIKVKRLADKVGLNPANLYEITYGKTKTISLNVADHIKAVYPYVSMEWLLTGRGEMLEKIDGDDEQSEGQSPSPGNDGTDKEQESSVAEKVAGPFPGCEIYNNIYCTTMKPVIDVGDQLLVSKWEEGFITWGKPYIVETKKGNTTIAYLFPSSKDDCYVCRSADPQKHPDVEVPICDINSLRIVHYKLIVI